MSEKRLSEWVRLDRDGTLDLARPQAAGTHPQSLVRAVHHGFDPVQVRLLHGLGFDMGVANIIGHVPLLSTQVTYGSHNEPLFGVGRLERLADTCADGKDFLTSGGLATGLGDGL
jgi:hypothetical protein